MNEIKCPKCGEVFTVDESGYIAILGQVRDAEFRKELVEREKLLKSEKDNELKLVEAKAKADFEKSLSESRQEIEQLKSQIREVESAKLIALKEEEVKNKDELSEKNALISKLQDELERKEKLLIAEKESELKIAEATAKAELEKTLSEAKQEIEQLKSKINIAESEKTLALKDEEFKKKDELLEKDKLISKMQTEIESSKTGNEIEIRNLKENYEMKLKQKDETIDYYKDLKTKLSTKMLGETLEQHCEIEFNRLRSTGFQKAYFEKDNDAKSGSKGDYIFKEISCPYFSDSFLIDYTENAM